MLDVDVEQVSEVVRRMLAAILLHVTEVDA